MWGEVMIQGLWVQQAESIIGVKLGDADADSYKYEPMENLLDCWETINKDTHGKHCNDQRKHFSPFVLSVYGILGREALVLLAQLSQIIAEKRDKPILHVRVWINGQITTVVARSYSHMIRGS